MKVRDVEFGPILGASGVQGFFGEGYPYHRYLALLPGFDFNGMTFVAKTVTVKPNKGNMPLEIDLVTPLEFKPRCMEVNFWKGIALNAVGLSNPGARYFFGLGEWQNRTEPFFLSFMSIGGDAENRLQELKEFVKIFQLYLPEFKSPVGLQINFSCPNVGLRHDSWEKTSEEICSALDIAAVLDIPLMPKFNVLTPMRVVDLVLRKGRCDAICVSNTIPWGSTDRIDWKRCFGSVESPLVKRGFTPGGLSGAPLLPLVCEWVKVARRWGIKTPINAGGGILCSNDVNKLKDAGASSVFLGSVAILRPWRVREIIERAREILA